MLELSKVRKSFAGPEGPVDVLKDVSLSVTPGEFVAVRGPSGCGKTTLLLTAGGLLGPGSGTVAIDNQDVYQLGSNQRSRLRADKIGFVFQQFHLIPYLTVIDNIVAPSAASPRPDARKRALNLIRHFNLEHRTNHVPAQLSTGECQRTALARALLNEPRLILADEPTGNLDKENSEIVLGFLAEFARKGGSVLVGSHDQALLTHASRCLEFDYGMLHNVPRTGSPDPAHPVLRKEEP